MVLKCTIPRLAIPISSIMHPDKNVSTTIYSGGLSIVYCKATIDKMAVGPIETSLTVPKNA